MATVHSPHTEPKVFALDIRLKSIFLISTKIGNIQPIFGQLVNISQKIPSHLHCFFLQDEGDKQDLDQEARASIGLGRGDCEIPILFKGQ